MVRPKIFQVIPTDTYQVYVYYDNGEIRRYDCLWVLDEGGVFQGIKDLTELKAKCTVMNGTLAWDISGVRDPATCIDLCPDTVYDESVPTSDPLDRPA